jgi:murein DD-endopeptidase MepM/ murein hydrolase activator NlpD
VDLDQVTLPPGVSPEGFLPLGQTLAIPNLFEETTSADPLLPDSELVNSPTSVGFDLPGFVQQAGGYLSTYHEPVQNVDLSGAAIVQRVANELSINPRLLLAILEFRSHWVLGQPPAGQDLDHPIGFYVPNRAGLYQEVMIAATQLNVAYYGWRQGTLTEIEYHKGRRERLNPTLNAGSVALQHLFALLYSEENWGYALYGTNGLAALYLQMFGDPWARAAAYEPLFPPGLAQPALELPFASGERWSLTAGPHPSWNSGTPRGALDFSPVTGEAVCAVSRVWVTASAPGLIVRSADNAVVEDLDGDGNEQTGWVLLYYHLAGSDVVSAGVQVALDDPLGHPSCEGGRATGKHVHLARKYNGEWLAADGPLPFVLSGWRAVADSRNYYGSLVKDDLTVSSNSSGSHTSIIVR